MNGPPNIEVEIKLPFIGPPALLDAGFELIEVTPRHFEDNWLFDTAEGDLKVKGRALRVRQTPHGAVLTYKGRPAASDHFKIREEIELTVSDAESMILILERLGLKKHFRYQKYRTVYRVAAGETHLLAMFDETPLGDFLELEGSEEAIVKVAAALGFVPQQFITKSYVALQTERCKAAGQPLTDLVFEEGSASPSAEEASPCEG